MLKKPLIILLMYNLLTGMSNHTGFYLYLPPIHFSIFFPLNYRHCYLPDCAKF